jgi:uncharacterized membrane protein YciS (DUF1049 family)
MIPLFAHHVQPEHIPVLAVLFAAGFWLGWQLVSRSVRKQSP